MVFVLLLLSSFYRRTFKDTITFIPVVIILLIPLSPIGHVLVFGAIQRVFPDFFPSCFTERRQNLLGEDWSQFLINDLFSTTIRKNLNSILLTLSHESELYESTEYSAVTINENWQASKTFALWMTNILFFSSIDLMFPHHYCSSKNSSDCRKRLRSSSSGYSSNCIRSSEGSPREKKTMKKNNLVSEHIL